MKCSLPDKFSLRVVDTRFNCKDCRAVLMRDTSGELELERMQKERAQGRIMLGALTHELRTPLSGMVGMLEVLDREVRSAAGKKFLRVARSATEQMMMLVQDILDFSQLDATVLRPNAQRFSVRLAASECVDLLAERFESRHLLLQLSVDPLVPREVISDRMRYKQILLNLLSNALKFTQAGSVTVTVRSLDGTRIQTEVADTGVGLMPDELPKLFKLFGKLERTRDINPNGVGFGLNLCRRLSTLLGGDIWVSSTLGKGSTFSFTVLSRLVPPEELKGEEDKLVIVNPSEISLKECNSFATEDEGTLAHESRGFFDKRTKFDIGFEFPVPSIILYVHRWI